MPADKIRNGDVKMTAGNRDIKYFMLLFPLFKPMGAIELYPIVDSFYDAARVLVFAYVLANMFKKFKPRFKVKKLSLLAAAVIYRICMCVAFLHGKNLSACLGTTLVCLAGVFVIVYLGEKDIVELFKVCTGICLVLITLDLVLSFFYPHGLTPVLVNEARVNFLGKDNYYILWALVALFFAYGYKELEKSRKIFYFIFLAECTAAIALRSSTTSKAVWILVLTFLLIEKMSFVMKCMTFRNVMCFLAFMNYALVVLNMQFYVGGLIHSLTGKGSDFSTRVDIWATMKRLIAENPILGTGKGTAVIDAWRKWSETILYAHNMVLDILLKGGMAAFLGFLAVLFVWNSRVAQKRLVHGKYYFFCILILLALGIDGLMEGFEDSVLFWIFLGGSYLRFEDYTDLAVNSDTPECTSMHENRMVS